MQILTKKKLRFRGGAEVFVSMGGNNIQAAPDWIEKDPLFPLAVKDGSLKPVLVAFEPGYESGPNGEGALIEAGKSFTSRIWAINDLHSRIDDVRLFWKIEEEQSGQVRAGNCFRLHLNPDSAEIPDHAIFVTNEEDKGKTFLMTAIIDTDECELTQNCLQIKVV